MPMMVLLDFYAVQHLTVIFIIVMSFFFDCKKVFILHPPKDPGSSFAFFFPVVCNLESCGR